MFLLIGLFDFNPCIYTEVISQGNFDFPPNACNLREQVQYIPISVSHISCSIEKKLLVSFTHVFKTPQISSYLFFQSSETGKHHIFHTDSKFGFMSQPCNCEFLESRYEQHDQRVVGEFRQQSLKWLDNGICDKNFVIQRIDHFWVEDFKTM